jgi:hypothetical protein
MAARNRPRRCRSRRTKTILRQQRGMIRRVYTKFDWDDSKAVFRSIA